MSKQLSSKVVNRMVRCYNENKGTSNSICLRPLASKFGISAATAKKYLNQAGIETKKDRCFKKNVWERIEDINKLYDNYRSHLTLRQYYYLLLPKYTYSELGYAGRMGRKYGYISWKAIEDRTRIAHTASMWHGVEDFVESIRNVYRRDVWHDQPKSVNYFEVWTEKDAIYGFLAPICFKYGITLQVCRGYASLSSIHEATGRLSDGNEILYVGDCDPSGINMQKTTQEAFEETFGLKIKPKRIALKYEDIDKYHLRTVPIKGGDTRTKRYPYDKAAEVDALPPDILKNRLERAITKRLDMKAFNKTLKLQDVENKHLNKLLTTLTGV